MEESTESQTENLSELPEVEDDSLDDFFAKKDKGKKGKKKKKSKSISTEALAKTLEKISTGTCAEEEETKPVKKDKEGTKNQDGSKGTNENDGDEWHEYEDESQRDYSDLKIQNFQISEEKPVDVYEPQYDDEGELIPRKEDEGPWKSVGRDLSANVAPDPTPTRKTGADTPPEQPATTKSVYRPPHARSTGSAAGTPSGIPPGTGRRRRPQETPVINSEIDFPSLASAVQDTEQHSGFETVKAGSKSISRNQRQQETAQVGLTLGNQFAALRD